MRLMLRQISLVRCAGLVIALLALANAPRAAGAQQPSAKTQVTLALATADNKHKGSRIERFKNKDRSSVIMLAEDDLTPEALASLMAGLGASRRMNGAVPSKDMTVRVSSPLARKPLSTTQWAHYQSLIDRLRAAPVKTISGLGKVQAIDISVITSVGSSK